MGIGAVEQLRRAASLVARLPPSLASSVIATRAVRVEDRRLFRAMARRLASELGLYVTIEEGELCSACFFRRDE